MNTLKETLTKAAQCADLLTSDIREAHKAACTANPFAEIVLLETIAAAAALQQKLERLTEAAGYPLTP